AGPRAQPRRHPLGLHHHQPGPLMRATSLLMLALFLPAWIPSPTQAAGASNAADRPPSPADREDSDAWDVWHHALDRPAARALDVPLLLRNLTGHRREAANVGADDQVRLPSTWWQPRVGFREITVAEMLAAAGADSGPAGRSWTVTKAKTQGVTPGFQIKDQNGHRFIVKFDRPAFPELTTSLDVVGSCLLWAAGYNVPRNTIVFFRREDLGVDSSA